MHSDFFCVQGHLFYFFQLCDNAMVEAFGLAAEIITCGPEAVKTCLATLRSRQENANLGLKVIQSEYN